MGSLLLFQKYWVDKNSKNSFFLYARSLSILWGEDKRYWQWRRIQETSDEVIEVAELLDVCWLDVTGKFETASLSPGTLYELAFVVKIMKDLAYGWEAPVDVELTLPNGTKQEHKENMKEKPRGNWIEIPVGEFVTSSENIGEIKFSIYRHDGLWKRGLVVKGITIRPKY
ncbi:hypothetical protein I3760_09G077400 [Carya illinoinensis]|nr:hypothetical protein I3760_09G077400 [Carya illinoinensis]